MQYQVQSRFKQTLDSKSGYAVIPVTSGSYKEMLPISTEVEDEDIYVPKIYQRHRIIPTYKAKKIQPEVRQLHPTSLRSADRLRKL